MNTDPIRSDDGRPEPEGDESAARLRPLGGHLGAALAHLKGNIEKKRIAAPQAREPEEKPFVLPLIDEEELAAITDPHERERSRRSRIELYKQHPNALAHYMERSEQLKAERNKVVMLQPWADDKRAAPNIIYRSALFPALNTKQRRRFVQNQKVFSVSGLEVTFTGQQFDQTDLDVYLEILNLAKAVPLGQPVKFSAYSMLKALGRCTGKSDHLWLHSVLIRLRGGTVEMVTGKARFFGGLIEGGIRDEITHHYEVIINPSYAKFFGFGLWSSIDLDQRRALEQNSTAKALHAYYSSHTDPAPHRYDTLAGIVGLEGKNKTAVRNSLIRAHEVLKRIGFLLDYEAGPDKIAIKATMTPSQQRHVIKKTTLPKTP